MEVYERFFVDLLCRANLDKLDIILENDISLREAYFKFMYLLPLAKMILGKPKLNLDRILSLMKEGNIYVYKKIINHPNGKDWLRKRIKEIEQEI